MRLADAGVVKQQDGREIHRLVAREGQRQRALQIEIVECRSEIEAARVQQTETLER